MTIVIVFGIVFFVTAIGSIVVKVKTFDHADENNKWQLRSAVWLIISGIGLAVCLAILGVILFTGG